MADMRYVLPGTDTIILSAQAADKLIRTGDGNAALLYLHALRTGDAGTLKQAAAMLRCSEAEVAVSMKLLGKLGLLKYEESSPPIQHEELPEYTAADIKRELENGSVFQALVQEVQKSLGKILSSDDLIKLFGIYDNLGLPPELILQLVTYCVGENARRYGTGRKPTMRYIEKVAFTWEHEGILTLEKAEQYIKNLELRRGQVSIIKRVLQIKDRELAAGERKYVESWIARGFSPEVIELAYDRTLLKTGKLAWSYMDSIIGSWQAKGLRTPEEIQAKDGKGSSMAKKRTAQTTGSSAPSQSDIEHMKKFLDKLREE